MSEKRPHPDGGTARADVERAGESPPDAPSDEGLDRLLGDLLSDVDAVDTVYLVRAAFAGGDPHSTAQRLVAALEEQVTVVGDTLDAGFDPSNPELDVLIETHYDPGTVAGSMAGVDPVDGVLVVEVTGAAGDVLADDGETADGAGANDVFNDLKEEVSQANYGDVVDELEDVSFPGGPDPDEEIDLQEETGIELEDDEPETIDLEGEDEEDLDIGNLLGDGVEDADAEEPGPGADEPIEEADEDAVSEAIRQVELDDPGGPSDGEPAGPEPAGSSDGAAGEPGTDADADDVTEADDDGGDADAGGAAVDTGGNGGDEETTAGGASVTAPGGGAGGSVPVDVDAFVRELVGALESGAIEEDRRVALREALGIESTHSLDVRLEYLQKRVDNLAAYTDAWEAFLDEEGTGREFVEAVREDVDALEERVADVERGAGAGGDLETVERRLADLQETVSELDERLAQLQQRHDEDVARLDTRMDSVESKAEQRLDGLEDTVDSLREHLETLLQWREHINEVLSGGAD